MLITALEKEEKEIYEKGKIKGKAEGMEEGLIAGKIETAKRMLSKAMDISLISEITGLSEKEILRIKENH